MLLPGGCVAFGGRFLAKTRMENKCCDDEQAENNDLHDQTGDDNVVAYVGDVDATCGYNTSACRKQSAIL